MFPTLVPVLPDHLKCSCSVVKGHILNSCFPQILSNNNGLFLLKIGNMVSILQYFDGLHYFHLNYNKYIFFSALPIMSEMQCG